jgi:hypothetical protein
VLTGVLSRSDYVEEEDERKKEYFSFHPKYSMENCICQIVLYIVPTQRQSELQSISDFTNTSDYLADVLRISMSLFEVSSVIFCPPPFKV